MKKLISLIAATLFCGFTFVINASFVDESSTDNLYYEFDLYDSTQVYVAYTPGLYFTGNISVPDSVTYTLRDFTGAPIKKIRSAVTGIGAHAFEGMPITSISLPGTLMYIADSAFNSCSALEGVSLPENLGEIGKGAFQYCTTIKNFVIPASIYYIDKNAFGGDNNITAVIPSSLESILFEADHIIDINDDAFSYVDSTKVILYVKKDNLEKIKNIQKFAAHFKAIYAYDDGTVNLLEESESSVKISWAAIEEAEQYTLTIKQEGVLFREYIIDKTGNVVSYKLPAAIEMAMDTTTSTTDMCVISISGLSANVNYEYEITGVDKAQNAVYSKSGTFRISAEGAITHTPDNPAAPSSITDMQDNINFSIIGNNLNIYNPEHAIVSIYSINGKMINQTTNQYISIELPHGSYIVTINNDSHKINIL